jgi:hypothetical protein
VIETIFWKRDAWAEGGRTEEMAVGSDASVKT